MKFYLISPGKKHDALLVDFIREFETRLTPHVSITWEYPAAGNKKDEAKKILELLHPDDFVLLLDEKGKMLSTPLFSELIEKKQNESVRRFVIVIGGAYGVDEDIKERADFIFSLSPLVFPHMLVRAIIVEQLYRSYSLISGGKYHHE
jgi:23S rRNA (pseudouridine1915-N3)-methyltransferase